MPTLIDPPMRTPRHANVTAPLAPLHFAPKTPGIRPGADAASPVSTMPLAMAATPMARSIKGATFSFALRSCDMVGNETRQKDSNSSAGISITRFARAHRPSVATLPIAAIEMFSP